MENSVEKLGITCARLTLAGEVGSTGLIIVPAFNDQKSVPHQQARELLTGFKTWNTPAPASLSIRRSAESIGAALT